MRADKEMDRWTDKHMNRQTKRYMERRTDQQLSKKLEGERQKVDSDVTTRGLFVATLTDRHTEQRDVQKNKQTWGQKDKETNGQTDSIIKSWKQR